MIRTTFRQGHVIRLGILTAVALLLAGCDVRPAPPTAPWGRHISIVSVPAENRSELDAATAAETARANYRYQLQVLLAYYDRVGNADRYSMAQQELKNLDQAYTFRWEGLPEIAPPEGQSLADADESALVERAAVTRKSYCEAMDKLAGFYERSGDDLKARLIRNVVARLDPIRTYTYYLPAEVPSSDLKPAAMIPEADSLFAEAVGLHESGKGLLHMALSTDYNKERQALAKFLDLLDKYPTSNKAPEAAYYIAEIYKEYFNEDIRAIRWYERAWQWDPNILKPARFQAATVYDLRLHEYDKAIECYRGAIQSEQFNSSNVRFARQRIRELTER